MRRISANFIFSPENKLVKNGILIVENNGRIQDFIFPEMIDYTIEDIEFHKGIICPGFVNTHCHLELSYLKGAIQEKSGLDEFIIQLENIRKFNKEEIAESAIQGEKEMIENGIVAVGDICNTNQTFALKDTSSIKYFSFVETFSSDPNRADYAFDKALWLYNEITANSKNKNASITIHAPYSLSQALFLKVKDFAEKNKSIISMHHQESEDENSFFRGSNDNINERHKKFGVDTSVFYNIGLSPLESIIEYIPNNNPFLLVHNTISKKEDIDFAKNNLPNAYWCLCPNANLFIEDKLPNFQLFIDENCKITLGTDSLASNKCLSILEEMKTISRNAENIPLETLLKWATINGAEFLKFDKTLGSFEKGKSPGINLIENVDLLKLKLKEDSRIRVL
jgi:cytosine/adenosine deaminase-related metal-dependent hydrolase